MRYCIRSIIISIAAFVFAGGFLTHTSAQRTFSHYTRAHREGKFADCNMCHTVPSRNWTSPRPDREDPFPDVTTFPYNVPGSQGRVGHTACVGCHQKDFYSTSFCAGCHSKAGPRVSRSDNVFSFPNKSHPTQFVTIFPHDTHQDVIASNDSRNQVAFGHVVFAKYTLPDDEKKPDFYNCSICHDTAKTLPKFAPREPTEQVKPSGNNSVYPFGRTDPASDPFKPTADYFKSVPMSHASCFNCHYQRIEPTSTHCDGCHKLADKPYFDTNVVERYSLKFSHDAKDKDGKFVHAKDCMTCHLRTAGSSDLHALKNKREPEVPFSTCVSCHGSDISDQFDKRDKDKNFQCNYCHVSAIGRYEKPDSHRQ
jgi:hypothetical protein